MENNNNSLFKLAKKSLKDYPHIITNNVRMRSPNAKINIYKGIFMLATAIGEISLEGVIEFEWQPTTNVRFKGRVVSDFPSAALEIDYETSAQIKIDNFYFGDALINHRTFGSDVIFAGIVVNRIGLGDRSIQVNVIRFSVPNLHEFFGSITKKIVGRTIKTSKSRISLLNDEYDIHLDKVSNFKYLYEKLNANGGYLILYKGEIICKKSVSEEKVMPLIQCLSLFLTFINGRRISPMILQGLFENEVKWTSYSQIGDTAIFKNSFSCIPNIYTENLNIMWKKLTSLCAEPDYKDFIHTAIHWYIEANNNSGYLEGSIIMAQTGLELLYNWLVIEHGKLLVGKDSENINASNKIRLLISQIGITNMIPTSFTNLQDFMNQNKEIYDGVDAIVQIRNAIVHSQEEKRKKLRKITPKAMYESLQLSLFYLEVAILKILDYKGEFNNRCENFLNQRQTVPWTN